MSFDPTPPWLHWAQQLQAIAQNGLTFGTGPFDLERYRAIRDLAAEIVAAHSTLGAAGATKLWDAEKGYMTPKVDVRAAVFKDDRILLVREKSDGKWTLPGGWVDVGESAAEAVVKEVREESGYETRTTKLLAVYDMKKHDHPPQLYHALKLMFRCELLGGAPAESLETDAVEFFAEQELPTLSRGRVTERQIARLFAHFRDPGLPTDFD